VKAIKRALSDQPIFFGFGIIIFIISAVLGWEKLHYGFSFLDEGWHMTESWRLASGDHFLRDKTIGAHMLYTLINSVIFRIYPDITLLGFRKLQYCLTICSLIALGVALFKVDRQYWYQPFVFSLFAFTGLSPIGWNSNLNYYTYPHLFLTLYLSFFILALFQKRQIVKRVLYVISGLFLWGISFNLLHLSLVVFSPIILFLVMRKLKLKFFSFGLSDLCYVLAPFIFSWAVFVGVYNKAYILAVLKSVSYNLSTPIYAPSSLVGINWEAVKHICVCLLVLAIGIFGLRKLRFAIWIAFVMLISILMFFIIDTSFFDLIRPYFFGWYSRPMWFSCLLISFFLMVMFGLVRKFYVSRPYSKGEEVCIVLGIPSAILFLNTSFFSGGMGILTALHSSIPATAAIAGVVFYNEKIHMKSYLTKLLILVILFLPFYYTTAWSDWRYTYFDVFPEQANVTIEDGFGRGIKTNPIYAELYEWVRVNTEKYTQKDDLMISYVLSPMVYMIAKRRPSLWDTYTNFIVVPMKKYEESIEAMKERGRYPKIAFVFESMPAFYPVSLKENRFKWIGKQFTFPSSDPISRYIIENMELVEECKIREGNIVRCFVDRKAIHKRAMAEEGKIDESIAEIKEKMNLDGGNPELHYNLGNLYKKKGKLDEAIGEYEKALSIQPELADAIDMLALVYMTRGEYEKAVSLFERVAELQPDNAGAYYNIACLYAIQNRVDESIDWLDKAIKRGYQNWDLIKNDKDLENIRGSSYYKEIIKGR
jgi:hypothetical protein